MFEVDISDAFTVNYHGQQEMIDATPLQEPDPNWLYIDAEGHEHRWWHDRTPTLQQIIDIPSSGDPGEDDWTPAVTHLECIICGEHIEPGWRTPLSRRMIGGLKSYTLEAVVPAHHWAALRTAWDTDWFTLRYQGHQFVARVVHFVSEDGRIRAAFDVRPTPLST